MKNYEIKYNTQNVINKTAEIKAENRDDAMYLFHMNYREATEVLSVEEVMWNETISTPN